MQLTRVPVTVDEELLLLRELVACLVDRVGDDDYAEAAWLLEDVTTRISTHLDGREQPTPETPVPLPAAGNRITGVAESIVAGVPRDAVAGVITRGEQALLDTPGRTCRHFPAQSDGQWVGFHPRDDEQAINLLAEAQRQGITHLVIPSTSMWWLQHYRGLRAHLERSGELVHASEHALIYRLPNLPATMLLAHQGSAPLTSELDLAGLRSLVAAVLPPRCTVLTALDVDLDLGERKVVPFAALDAQPGRPSASDSFVALQRARRAGAQYLIVCPGDRLSSRIYDTFHADVRASFPIVVERAHIAVIYRLDAPFGSFRSSRPSP